MSKNWKKIWKDKEYVLSDSVLSSLIKTDGFDSIYAQYTEEDWNKICLNVVKILQIKKENKILEVGCGAGALIYGISQFVKCNFYGVDYSNKLIKIAKMVMPNFYWKQMDSNKLRFKDSSFDGVIVHSVLQYMPDETYAKKTLDELVRVCKSKKNILILDIYDLSKKNKYLEVRAKMLNLTIEQYISSDFYIDHYFFNKEWLIEYFLNKGIYVEILEPFYISNKYKNCEYSFNMLLRCT